jgi:ferric-dicitrate binding protein FerR (iron transport regulator)
MDRRLLDNYFNDRCSEKELEQVLGWFQTEEGRWFLEKDINRQARQIGETEGLFLCPEMESEKLFNCIQRHKRIEVKQEPILNLFQYRSQLIRVASIVLIAAAVSLGLYWSGIMGSQTKKPTPAFITYVTAPGQQKVFSLSDGIRIRLAENSTLTVPTHFTQNRTLTLKGEAYFQVTHDADHPFVVNANGAVIKDLGTKFNIKTDSSANAVEVAVIEGRVKLKKKGKHHQTSAILTHNHFGVLNLSNGQITIEEGNVKNYLSWMTGRLVFRGEPLGRISRQLQRLYNVEIHFQSDQLKKIRLTANYGKTNLKTVLKLIARTLDIRFKMNGRQVIWIE